MPISLGDAPRGAQGPRSRPGAAFNSAYTLRHGEEFYTGFVEGAWFRPARRSTESIVVPNATPFTVVC